MSSESDRAKKLRDEQTLKVLNELLKDPANCCCADCGARGPRWASYNLGVFLCIRCGGLHRRLGTHISRIKSITLDSWTDEQLQNMKDIGNAKANEKYCPNPDAYPAPTHSDFQMEQYIRDKYANRKFMNDSDKAQDNRLQVEKKFSNELRALKEMGFTDTAAAITALQKTKGNVETAIDLLVKDDSPVAEKPSDGFAEKELNHLKSLGYSNEQKNSEALKTANGIVEEAIKTPNEAHKNSAPAAAQPNTTSNVSAQNELFDLFSAPALPAPNAPQPQIQSQQRQQQIGPFGAFSEPDSSKKPDTKLGKDSILSLYNAPPQPMAMMGVPMAMPMSMSMPMAMPIQLQMQPNQPGVAMNYAYQQAIPNYPVNMGAIPMSVQPMSFQQMGNVPRPLFAQTQNPFTPTQQSQQQQTKMPNTNPFF